MPRALPSDDDEVEHLAPGEEAHRLSVHLAHQRLVGAEKQLLPGLAARVEGPRHLRAAKTTGCRAPAVLARKRDPCATHWSMMLTLSCARR